jgi:hypothetical protein
MSALTNREKNTAHDQRSRVRPAPVNYNFADLDAVVRSWANPKEVTIDEEIYSPYAGA